MVVVVEYIPRMDERCEVGDSDESCDVEWVEWDDEVCAEVGNQTE